MPEFAIMTDEDLLDHVREEDTRCRVNTAAALVERQEDQEQVDRTKNQLVNLRLRYDYLRQHLNHPRITPARLTQFRNEIREIKGNIETLSDYLKLYFELMSVREQ